MSNKKKVVEVQLCRLHINKDGYTTGGYYYGVGQPVFFYGCLEYNVWGTMRARGVREARRALTDKFNPDGSLYIKFIT